MIHIYIYTVRNSQNDHGFGAGHGTQFWNQAGPVSGPEKVLVFGAAAPKMGTNSSPETGPAWFQNWEPFPAPKPWSFPELRTVYEI